MIPSALYSFLDRFFRHFEIKGSDGSLYLRRWALVRLGPVRLNLHHIVRSDEDRFLHDHPWDFTSLIIRGGYTEQTLEVVPDGTNEPKIMYRWFGVGRILRRKAEHAHRLELSPERCAWTLVLLGPRRRVWGFHATDGWVPWRKYLGLPDAEPYGVDGIIE